MSDSKSIAELLKQADLDYVLHGSGEHGVSDIRPLEDTALGSLAFCKHGGDRGASLVSDTDPESVIVVPSGTDWGDRFPGRVLIETEHPRLLFILLVRALHPQELVKEGAIHPSAVVDGSAVIGPNTFIGPNVVIENDVVIGAGCQIDAGVTVHGGVNLGDRVVVQSNSVIGASGQASELNLSDQHVWLPHLGSVVIGNDVRIGANSTVVRGTLRNTEISDGVSIGNQANVGHNAFVGENVFIGVGAILAGSCHIEDGAWISPSAVILNDVRVGGRAMVAIGAVVMRDVDAGKMAVGNPAKIIAKLNTINDSRAKK